VSAHYFRGKIEKEDSADALASRTGNPGVRSVLCVHIVQNVQNVQNVRDLDASDSLGDLDVAADVVTAGHSYWGSARAGGWLPLWAGRVVRLTPSPPRPRARRRG
jgi:hypothetical protein